VPRIYLPAVVAVAIATPMAVLLLTGCGPGKHAGSMASPTSPAVKADETAAASVIDSCMPKNVLVFASENGRDAFAKCTAVPKANEAKFTSCLTTAAEADHLFTHAGRSRFTEVSAPHCYEVNR
jgi:hypothetical protein